MSRMKPARLGQASFLPICSMCCAATRPSPAEMHRLKFLRVAVLSRLQGQTMHHVHAPDVTGSASRQTPYSTLKPNALIAGPYSSILDRRRSWFTSVTNCYDVPHLTPGVRTSGNAVQEGDEVLPHGRRQLLGEAEVQQHQLQLPSGSQRVARRR